MEGNMCYNKYYYSEMWVQQQSFSLEYEKYHENVVILGAHLLILLISKIELGQIGSDSVCCWRSKPLTRNQTQKPPSEYEPKNNKPVETFLVSYHQFMLEVVTYNLWGLPWVFSIFMPAFLKQRVPKILKHDPPFWIFKTLPKSYQRCCWNALWPMSKDMDWMPKSTGRSAFKV